jgi:hypothetical protein
MECGEVDGSRTGLPSGPRGNQNVARFPKQEYPEYPEKKEP